MGVFYILVDLSLVRKEEETGEKIQLLSIADLYTMAVCVRCLLAMS